jgi:hypothetical protein
MCCGLYDAGMFTQMEMHVLNTLDWNIGHPTVDFFTQLVVAEERDSLEVEHMAAYICEVALYHRDFVSTKPSVMARASLALARAILGKPEVNDGEWDHLDNVTLLTLSQHLHQPSVTLARKYSSQHYLRVSTKLADFLAQQAAIARRGAPPSPPAEPTLSNKAVDVYSTPHKGLGAVPGVADGYMTPPITPDGTCFGHGNAMIKDYQVPPRCPVTPTPQSSSHAPSYPPQPQLPQQHMAGTAYYGGTASHMSY